MVYSLALQLSERDMMKKVFALLLTSLIFVSCEPNVGPEENSQMVVYVVDYRNNRFEAGTVLNLTKVNIGFNSIDIDIIEDEVSGENDGAVSLFYSPTNEKIFEGSINLEGSASINFPGMAPGVDFFEIETPVSLNSRTVEDIGGPYNDSFTPAWGAIDHLGLTEIFVNNNAMIGRYLYRPAEDNDQNWKWIVLLFDQ